MRFAPLLILASAILAISACDQAPSYGEKIVPTRDDKTFTMTVETVPESRITEQCATLGVKYEANGCAAFDLDKKHCTIYVVEPRGLDDMERLSVIGHETWHCRFGQWHQ